MRTVFSIISEKQICYNLHDFKPIHVTGDMLRECGIDYPISDKVAVELETGSEWFMSLHRNRSLTPSYEYTEAHADIDSELEIHNYTGICPTNVLEVTPSAGSCAVACQYCLVTDGKHCKEIELFTNYTEKLAASLERNCSRQIYYYFSPKTEAFSEPHLQSGIAHDILRTFLRHFETHPDSSIRLFIATKAGPQHLGVKHKGDSVFKLLGELADKTQVNGSIGIMPQYLRDVLEPNAATIAERLEALEQCQSMGVWAESVLCQPLMIPYLTNESIEDYLSQLAATGIRNIKPEFFTAEVRNLVLVAQYINYFDPNKMGEFFHPYLREDNFDHIKQRSRLAPDRRISLEWLAVIRDIAHKYGITISICNWVKKQLGSVDPWVKSIDAESKKCGYCCLGYQTKLFPTANASRSR